MAVPDWTNGGINCGTEDEQSLFATLYGNMEATGLASESPEEELVLRVSEWHGRKVSEFSNEHRRFEFPGTTTAPLEFPGTTTAPPIEAGEGEGEAGDSGKSGPLAKKQRSHYNAFNAFQAEYRLTDESEGNSMTNLIAPVAAAVAWHALDPEEKKVYKSKAMVVRDWRDCSRCEMWFDGVLWKF